MSNPDCQAIFRIPLVRLKVLHAIDVFLSLTENWIYPQVTRVPDVESAIICRYRINADKFPFPNARLFASHRRRGTASWVIRAAKWIGARSGASGLWAGLCAAKWQPQLLHAHFGSRGWEILPLKRKARIPLVTSFYGYDAWFLPEQGVLWRERYAQLFEEGDLFLVEGPAMKDRLANLGCPAVKILVHRIGVDLAYLSFRPRKFQPPLKVLMVGSLVEKKGFRYGLEACLRVRACGGDLDITIVGDSPPGRPDDAWIKAELQGIASRPELAGRVTFKGYLGLGETLRELEKHDILLAPSQHSREGDAEGGSPVVLTQAMALGLICIGTRHCDIPSIVRAEETGYLCEEKDSLGIANALTRIATAPDEAMRFASNGRRLVEVNFNLDVQMKKQAAIYTCRICR